MPKFSPATSATRQARVLLLGEPKTGKTLASLSFPGPFVIDAEGSSDIYAESHPHQRLVTKSYADALAVVREIIDGRHPDCQTLVIDSLTSIYNTLVLSQAKGDGSVDKRGWGLVKRKFAQFTDLLFYEMPCNVVAVGWIKPQYAVAGEMIEGQRVSKDDTIITGQKYDGDAKTVYAFDSVWRLTYDDKSKSFAAIAEGARGAVGTKYPRGSSVPNFSWTTIAPFYAKATGTRQTGMTQDEAAARDREALVEGDVSVTAPTRVEPPAPAFGELYALHRTLFGAAGAPEVQAQAAFKTWLRDVVGVEGSTMTVSQKRMAATILEQAAEEREHAEVADSKAATEATLAALTGDEHTLVDAAAYPPPGDEPTLPFVANINARIEGIKARGSTK